MCYKVTICSHAALGTTMKTWHGVICVWRYCSLLFMNDAALCPGNSILRRGDIELKVTGQNGIGQNGSNCYRFQFN